MKRTSKIAANPHLENPGGPCKCDQPECGFSFPNNRRLGIHKRAAHGIKGEHQGTNGDKPKQTRKSKHKVVARLLEFCPHCGLDINRAEAALQLAFHGGKP